MSQLFVSKSASAVLAVPSPPSSSPSSLSSPPSPSSVPALLLPSRTKPKRTTEARRVLPAPLVLLVLFAALVALTPLVVRHGASLKRRLSAVRLCPSSSPPPFPAVSRSPSSPPVARYAAPALTVLTLSFNQTAERATIAHNCLQTIRTRHRLIIHTDDVTAPYCRRCECREFRPTNCMCPKPRDNGCALCEKLAFVASAVERHGEIIFLDGDLAILRAEFLDALALRTAHFDFLASYGFGDLCSWRYASPFNSGLMFMRRLPNLKYDALVNLMDEMGNNNDQNIISAFVRLYYSRWDVLGLQWHCRYLHKTEYREINVAQCMTFHGRGSALRAALSAGGMRLRTMGDADPAPDADRQEVHPDSHAQATWSR